ncbi:hypothetical protein [Vibrio mediterranei]|uniref:hypothetical protein n=1 Tax=Vibrio mediterranei TaxID=689 RepID=UPI00148C18CF|nr:hypothetical protein [Vibrio mediterranei]NOI25923.1 hypothetical protein [Vibrio mediterranei]
MSVIYLESVAEWFRFTDTPAGRGYLSLPVGRRNKTALLGYLNQCIDEREFQRLHHMDKHAPDEVRQTSFVPLLSEIEVWLQTFDAIGGRMLPSIKSKTNEAKG